SQSQNQIGFVDQRSTAYVNQKTSGFHARELLTGNHSSSSGSERRRKNQVVDPAEYFVEFHGAKHFIYKFRSSPLRVLAEAYYMHAKARGMLRDVLADTAQAHQSESSAGKLTRACRTRPQNALCPQVLLLIAHGFGNFFGQSKHQAEDMLGHNRS